MQFGESTPKVSHNFIGTHAIVVLVIDLVILNFAVST
jgi:hypothetical protein